MTLSRRATLVAAIAIALTIGGLVGHAAAAPPRQPVHPLLANTMAALTVNGPVTVNSDGVHTAMTIRGKAGSLAQLLEIKDAYDQPIVATGQHGGLSTFGDEIRVFHPGSVFGPAITLHYDGSLTLGQQVGSDASPIQQGGVTLYSGSADPNVIPPAHQMTSADGTVVQRPLVNGDRYLQSGGSYDTWVFINGTWTVK